MQNLVNPSQPGMSFGKGTPMIGAPASSILAQPGGISQQGPNSASFQNTIPPQVPSSVPQPSFQQAPQQAIQQAQQPLQAPMQQPMQQAPQQGVVGMPPSPSETEMILKALLNRYKTLNDQEDRVHKALFPVANSQGLPMGR